MTEPRLHPGWLEPLRGEFASDYMAALRSFLVAEKAAGRRRGGGSSRIRRTGSARST